jgi:hypothetical protein
MNNKCLVWWTLVVSLLVMHHAWLIYQISNSHAVLTEYTIALRSQAFCRQSVELDLIQVCEKRARWLIQPFWLNVVRLAEGHYLEMLHFWFDTFTHVCFENDWCAHGTICRYNVTKIIESMTSTFYVAIPCILVLLVVVICKRLLSSQQPLPTLVSQTCPSSIWQVPAPSEWSTGIHPREHELISRYNWLIKGQKNME